MSTPVIVRSDGIIKKLSTSSSLSSASRGFIRAFPSSSSRLTSSPGWTAVSFPKALSTAARPTGRRDRALDRGLPTRAPTAMITPRTRYSQVTLSSRCIAGFGISQRVSPLAQAARVLRLDTAACPGVSYPTSPKARSCARLFFKEPERLAYAMLILRRGTNERLERFSKVTTEIQSGEWLKDTSAPQLTPTG
jgi:hypothetical protein